MNKQMHLPPHVSLSHLPTPLEPLGLEKDNGYNLWVKRDDLTGMELSGNKIRKLDFLLQDALDRGANRVMTCGGLQSNHCRATAFAALRLGLKCTLVLRGTEPDELHGNYFLDRLSGCDIIFITPEQYKQVDDLMLTHASNYAGTVYVIPEGGSNAVGAWGYARCFDELMRQKPQLKSIVVASGSGGTHAGLLIGKLLLDADVDIVSVNVSDDAQTFVDKIDTILTDFRDRYGKNISWNKSDIKVHDGFVGKGYAQVDGNQQKAILKIARQSGLVLDPVYSAKAFLGFEDLVQRRQLRGPDAAFIHTGGIFGLLPFWPEFVEYL